MTTALPFSHDLSHWQEHATADSSAAMSALKAIQSMELPLWKNLEAQEDLTPVTELANHICEVADDLIIIGTGGSGLCGKTLLSAFNHGGPRQHYMDNADSATLQRVVSEIDLARTFVLVISKSGGTAEILALAVAFSQLYDAAGITDYHRHWAAITMDEPSALKNWAEEKNMRWLSHPSDIGGRYSVFTAVGMLPAAVAGLDVHAIHAGALQTVAQMRASTSYEECEAVHAAALSAALVAKGYDIAVMMPYVDRLSMMAAWCRQLWAESLGKDGKGITPVRALGAVDQHSQLQLYLDGPKNKSFTMLCHPDEEFLGEPLNLPKMLQSSHDWLHGHPLGNVLVAQQEGTISSLKAAGCPVREIRMKQINETVMGALFMQWMLEVIALGELMQVNAFDQPAVEDSKLRMRRAIEGLAA